MFIEKNEAGFALNRKYFFSKIILKIEPLKFSKNHFPQKRFLLFYFFAKSATRLWLCTPRSPIRGKGRGPKITKAHTLPKTASQPEHMIGPSIEIWLVGDIENLPGETKALRNLGSVAVMGSILMFDFF